MRHLPLPKHTHALAAAEATECAAAQERGSGNTMDLLLAHQMALSDADLHGYATQLGLDVGAFDACTASEASAARVDEDVRSAAKLNVQNTPTFFIGTERVIGLLSVAEFRVVLDAALAAPPAASTSESCGCN